jgi:hypothetical protein
MYRSDTGFSRLDASCQCESACASQAAAMRYRGAEPEARTLVARRSPRVRDIA